MCMHARAHTRARTNNALINLFLIYVRPKLKTIQVIVLLVGYLYRNVDKLIKKKQISNISDRFDKQPIYTHLKLQ